MKTLKKYFILFILISLSILPILPLYSQADTANYKAKSKAWIVFAKAKEYYNKKEYGIALKLFKDALNMRRGIFPEAEEGIGDIFSMSNIDLAIFHYKRALEYKNAFNIPDERYKVLYKLASLYKLTKKYNKMEETYTLILKDDAYYSKKQYEKLRTSIYTNFLNKGLDDVILLYRFNIPFSLKAHIELGYFYYQTGRYRKAISNLLFATINILSVTTKTILKHEPDYEFTHISDTIKQAIRYPTLKDYLIRSQLFFTLYYLGVATYAHGYIGRAKEVWEIVSGQTLSPYYRNKSIRQLKSPWKEPLLQLY